MRNSLLHNFSQQNSHFKNRNQSESEILQTLTVGITMCHITYTRFRDCDCRPTAIHICAAQIERTRNLIHGPCPKEDSAERLVAGADCRSRSLRGCRHDRKVEYSFEATPWSRRRDWIDRDSEGEEGRVEKGAVKVEAGGLKDDLTEWKPGKLWDEDYVPGFGDAHGLKQLERKRGRGGQGDGGRSEGKRRRHGNAEDTAMEQ
ncbi:hypothetical protein B0O99DRAFT_40937 [Bisporella sp. PMI_857]|nr:hypothetical protein B0O99DRAFT_40937 [Bisporella sp. PMI_857]